MLKTPPKITYLQPDPTPVFPTVRVAFSDAIAAFRAMPTFFIAAFVIFAANRLVTGPASLPAADADERLALHALAFLQTFVKSLLTVPIVVAFHRFAIFREVGSLSSLLLRRDTIILYLIVSMLPSAASFVLASAGDALPEEGVQAVGGLLFSVLLLVLAFWTIRWLPVLPAIAAEAPNVSLSGAARATRGGFWRLLAIMAVSVGVPLGVGYGLNALAQHLGLALAGSTTFAICAAIGLATGTMALSHAYMWLSQGPYGRAAALRRAAAGNAS